MKAMHMVAVLAVAAAAALPQRAEAINEEWSAVLGFFGGYMVANGGLCPRPVYVEQPVFVTRPVYVEQPVVYCPPPPPVIIEEPAGYYEWRPERIWVQGCWVYSHDHWGCQRRVWRPGYYRTQHVKVWVPGCRPVRRHCSRW